jgi:histidinol dehydrogenase
MSTKGLRTADAPAGAKDAARRPGVQRQVARIVADVRSRGDAAVREWSSRLDPSTRGARAGQGAPFEVTQEELRRGWEETPKETRSAIRLAARNVGRVARLQVPKGFVITVQPGVRIEQRVQPLSHVGCYVPGGRFPLVSTLIMTVVPAREAGVPEITVTCPAITPAICFAALEAGATRVLRLGGAQAIAALAYGTETIARADKIVGPGSAWVAAAKALVSADCAIDFHAGPSEIVVWSDRGRADWVAADLMAQAEHDPDARAILVTTNRELAKAVGAVVSPGLKARGSNLKAWGSISVTVVRTREEAIALVTTLAPEHLVCDNRRDAAAIASAGTIFVGKWSAQASGDYVTGSNHVLPTGGAARFRGGLSAADFVRTFAVQTLTRSGIRALGPSAVILAEAEGLTMHAESVRRRLSGADSVTPARKRR